MKYFKKEEMARCFRENGARCRGCKLKQRAEKLLEGCEENLEALVREVLDPAREAFGGPIAVNSGYRCPRHNDDVGGVPNSQHMRGEAADIRPAGAQVSGSKIQELGKTIERLGKFDQLIYYPTFVHVSWKRIGKNRKQIINKQNF